ncbi:MAG: vWA domain-containing protein, partial [Acidimicrobiia bacterium]
FQGEVSSHKWKRRRTEPRRLVLLLDVSGSMAAYSRSMLQFAHAAARNNAKVEVFCFGTRLTRITQSLRQRHREDALHAALAGVSDWEGGTRIGECIGVFLRTYGRHVLSRGALVVICSDGLERGDPAFLAKQMARLQRLAHQTVWVNPLKGDPEYLPLARGMHAALPYIDTFIPGHNLASLEALADVLKQAA